jgi:hypothetical protein
MSEPTAKTYKVLAACVVHVPTPSPQGMVLGTYYRDGMFSGNPDSDKIRHLIDGGMIVEVGADGQPVKTDEVKDAKLSIRSTKDDLVAAAVAKGMPEDDAKAMGKPDLLAWLEAPSPTP